MKPKPTRRRWLFSLLPALALWLGARAAVHAETQAPPPAAAQRAAPVPTADDAHPGPPQAVTVGLYLQSIPEIDVKTNSFTAEFYLWFLWKGDIDPTVSFQLTNAVNILDLTRTPIFVDEAGAAKPELLPDGRKYQQFHVYGRFGQPFPLARYPFDDHELVISLEDSRYPDTRLVHVLDARGSTMRPTLTIPGWNLTPMHVDQGRTQFATTFGDPRSGSTAEEYSRVDFRVAITRPLVGIISKTVIPIALIILLTFGAFFCLPTDIDARLSLTVTALISAVALQFTAMQELPPTGTLLLLDKVYILSYVAILAVTYCTIAANRAAHHEQMERAHRIDRWGLVLTALGYFGGLAIMFVRAH